MTTHKDKDPFDSADCYTAYAEIDAEHYVGSLQEALEERFPDDTAPPWPVIVLAYKRRTVDDAWIEGTACGLAEHFSEDYEDEYGGGDDPMVSEESIELLEVVLKCIIKHVVKKHPPWQCERVGERTYSPEEVAEILRGGG